MSEQGRIARQQFKLHLTDGEMDLLVKKADSCGLSMTAFLRRLITYGRIIHIVADNDAIRGLTRELNKIGTNINHIACIVNSTHCFDSIQYQKLEDAYENLFEIIENRVICADDVDSGAYFELKQHPDA